MQQLGISIYPNHSTTEKDKQYIHVANQYGFTRVFTCLLSVEQDNILASFKETIHYAKQLGMEVICDINPHVFKDLGISYDDLTFFKNLGADGIRLDLGFTGNEESMMTFNPHGLFIEVNMSNSTKYIDNILSFQPNRNKLIGCHNFYPHRYSGLSYDFFIECSEKFKKYGLRTAAFVSSQAATFGPWPIVEGLPTLEMHRGLPIDVQAKHLFATRLIDDVIIGNAYASEEELKRLSQINKEKLTFNLELVDSVSDLEKKILFDEPHFYRGDVSDYMIRSTQSRVKYRGEAFPPHNTTDIKRGDVVIESELYEQYAGELQIALKDMNNSGRTNVVARIREEEIFLIDSLKPWDKFAFSEWDG
ncbi:DUF871 domain-containing protein [Shouchella clausii]|uniref:DUF871 domain-containing protein n=1 Tax=Shouchella clausii TaxID=79880 RepID=UPI000BA55CE2|nr:DUF871 domain-containing protein [Shouchella clausii]MBU8595984.1 DUF871 domain-containing protein [Shouchella clausii]MCY1103172.1 DUF871 domain-containing protein [Shouchella clausii]MEB5479305.1 DUF871 domain-containing protein [Shouchella clausii]MED4158794.1 DUF871 domain-containing protein [Shouchella clausii]MED4176409.1 DUF871 domain-containing protein [Shouchella clausii]